MKRTVAVEAAKGAGLTVKEVAELVDGVKELGVDPASVEVKGRVRWNGQLHRAWVDVEVS